MTTTFVGKQQKQSTARSRRAKPYTPRRKNVKQVQQHVIPTQNSMFNGTAVKPIQQQVIPTQNNMFNGTTVNQYSGFQPVFSFSQLLTFIPNTCVGAGIQPSCAAITNNVCYQPSK